MTTAQLPIPVEAIKEFCGRWKTTEFALFGSVLREDFGPGSDVDVLITFGPEASWSYWEWPAMQDELGAMFAGRSIDLVEAAAVRNPFRRREIFSTRKVLYAA